MILQVDPGHSFRCEDAEPFYLMPATVMNFDGYNVAPEVTFKAIDPDTLTSWLVWCQPSNQHYSERSWFTMRDTGAGTEKIHRAKVL